MKNQNKLITKQTTVWVKVDSEYEDKHLFSDMALRYDYIGTELDRVKIFIHDTPTTKARKWKINVDELDTSDSGVLVQTVLNEALHILGILNKLETHGSCGYPWSKASSDAKAVYIGKTKSIARELMHECNLLASQDSPNYNTEFAYERLDRLCLASRASEFSLDEIEYVKVKQSTHDHTKLLFEKSPTKLAKEKFKRVVENSRYGAYEDKHVMDEVYEIAHALQVVIDKILAGPADSIMYSDYKRLIARLSDANGAIMHDSVLAIAANNLYIKINKLLDAFIANNEPDKWLHERVCDLISDDETKDLRWKINAICKYHPHIMSTKNTTKQDEKEPTPATTIESATEALLQAGQILTAINTILSMENDEANKKAEVISSLRTACNLFKSACEQPYYLYDMYERDMRNRLSKSLSNACDAIDKILDKGTETDAVKLAEIIKVMKSDDMLAARILLNNVDSVTNDCVNKSMVDLLDKLNSRG